MDPDEGTGVCRDFPADVLASILMRLPANTRRLLRLVCRHWRDVVGTRKATNLRSRAKMLVAATGYAYVVDDLSAMAPETGRRGRGRELWTGDGTARLYDYESMNIVGTCNGLVCLCDPDGNITVANPVTGEALDIPPLPQPAPIGCYSRSWHEGYSFAYLPTARQYKVVHVPCWVSGTVFNTVQVITLGEASWRDVHGRLGIVVSHNWSTEVWVMEPSPGRGEQEVRWSRWYIVHLSTPPHRCLTWPIFVHGEHVLAWEPGLHREGSVLYMHTLIRDDARDAKRGVVDVGDMARWPVVASYLDMTSYMSYRRTFAYVETKEPLGLYRKNEPLGLYRPRCDR